MQPPRHRDHDPQTNHGAECRVPIAPLFPATTPNNPTAFSSLWHFMLCLQQYKLAQNKLSSGESDAGAGAF